MGRGVGSFDDDAPGVRKMRWRWLTLWLVSWTAAAQAEQAQLVWERDPGTERCPTGREIARAVNARLGYTWLVPDREGGERAFGRVSKVSAGYEALLTLRDPQKRLVGTRRLHDASGDCATLAAASVLAFTLMAGAAPPASAASVTTPQRVMFSAEAGAVASLGLLSRLSPHAFARLDALLTRRFALEIEVLGFGSARSPVPDSRARVRTTPFLGSLAACVVLLRSAHLRWDACVGATAGAIRAQGEHFGARSFTAWSAFAAPMVRLPLRIPIKGPLQAGLALNLGVPLLRAQYEYLDPRGVRRTLRDSAPLFGWFELGLGATF